MSTIYKYSTWMRDKYWNTHTQLHSVTWLEALNKKKIISKLLRAACVCAHLNTKEK